MAQERQSDRMYVAGPGVVAARSRALNQTSWYAEPVDRRRDQVDSLLSDIDRLQSDIHRDGCLVIDLDRALEPAELHALARHFGTPMVERDQMVRGFVTDEVVLDLPTAYGSAAGTALEPFSSSALRMHTESSTLPAPGQPWLLLLACVTGARRHQGLQTILTPMAEVVRALPPETQRLLADIRVDRDGAPPMLRRRDGRDVLAVRDFAEPMPWTGWAGDPGEVAPALDGLWDMVYNRHQIKGIGWDGPCLLVLDNTRFLHGRTAAGRWATQGRRLLRVRVLTTTNGGEAG